MDGRLRIATGVAALLLTGIGGAGPAQAAPAFHCQASTATISGIGIVEPVSPVTAGGSGPCAEASVAPALPANPLIAADLLATTHYDAAAKKGTATGGLASLKVVPTPALADQLPTQQFIDALAPITKTLTIPLGPLNVPTPITYVLDVREALEAELPALPDSLLSAELVTARASVSCASDAPVLTGASDLAGLRIAGQEVPLNGPLSQAITLIGAQSIPLSSLDPAKVKILSITSAIPILGADLTTATDAILSNLSSLTDTFPLPATSLNVELTPGSQTRIGDSLVQRALTAHIDLGGLQILDAAIGEARVSADAGVCAPPSPVVEPPAPPDQGGVDAVTATGSVADQILACSDRRLVLMDVLRQGKAVKILGAANRDLAGRQVAIRLKAIKKVVGHATVQQDGSFQTTAPLPPAAYRSKAKADLVRYTAELGKERSLPLKLDRRMIVSNLTSKDGKVTITGRVTGPLTRPITTIRLTRRVSCKEQALVATFKPGKDGRFSITVDAPAGQAAAVYRMTTSVRANAKNPKRFPTFTLPRGVALDQR